MTAVTNFFKSDKLIHRLTFFLIGVLIEAVIYNVIFVPNNIVVGGISGLAIIIKELTGISTTIFIDVGNVLLLALSFMMLGKKKTVSQLVGCILYPLMITLTAPLARVLTVEISSTTLLIVIASLLFGVANGIIYRAGFSTGGTDIIAEIISRRYKKPISNISSIILISVIIIGGIVFSPVQIMYALLIIFISNKVTNTVMFGTSSSKMVYVISKKNNDIEDYIMNKINTGATEIRVQSGFFERRKQMLMCIVHNAQYVNFKHHILKLDPEAFILVNNCYEVNGGVKYNLLPF